MFDPLTTLKNIALTIFLVLAIYLIAQWVRRALLDWTTSRCDVCRSCEVYPYDTCWTCGATVCRECRLRTGDVELVEGHTVEDHKGVRV